MSADGIPGLAELTASLARLQWGRTQMSAESAAVVTGDADDDWPAVCEHIHASVPKEHRLDPIRPNYPPTPL
jgi:hypothetical protein